MSHFVPYRTCKATIVYLVCSPHDLRKLLEPSLISWYTDVHIHGYLYHAQNTVLHSSNSNISFTKPPTPYSTESMGYSHSDLMPSSDVGSKAVSDSTDRWEFLEWKDHYRRGVYLGTYVSLVYGPSTNDMITH